MPVDTSMYGTQTQPINPLAVMGQVAQTQNAMNQNKLFGQEFGARKAYGDIIQQSTDPTTGVTDFSKANALAAGNPATAFKAPEFAQQAIDREQGQTTLDANKLKLARDHFTALADGLSSIANKPDASYSDMLSLGTQMIADGRSRPQDVVGILSKITPNTPPAQIQALAKNLQLQALSGTEKINAMYGTPTAVSTGGQTNIVQTPTMGGPTTVNAVLPNTMTPEAKAARVPTFANGQPGTINQGSLADDYGNARPASGAQPSPLGTGRYPTPTDLSAPPAPPGTPAAPAGFVPSGPALGASTAADVNAGGSAKSLQDLHDGVANSSTRIYQLQAGLQALQGANTGKGSQTPQDIQSFIQTMSPDIAKAIGIDPQKVANYDEAVKYTTAYAQNQAGAHGPNTDSQLATALTANPSAHISNLAATDVMKANIGLERMKQAQAQAFDQSGLPPQDFNKWQVAWNKGTDVRAYIMDQLTPDQQSAMISKLPTNDKASFVSSLRTAIKGGFVQLPGVTNGGQ